MTDTLTEPQQQAEDDQEERRARYGGTDLFRGVLVLVIAAAVGILLVGQTPSSPRFLIDGEEEAAEDVADSTDDLDTPSADFTDPLDDADADSVDGDGSLGAGSAMVDEAEAGVDSADILPDLTEDEADSDSPGASVNPVGSEETDIDTTDTTDSAAGTATGNATDDATDDVMEDTAGRRPAEVTVIVLNHTTRKGIAGAESDKLDDAGYITLPAANAATSSGSGVYYAEGYQVEAEVMATTLGLTTTGLVRSLSDPTAPTVASDVDVSTANVIVVLGKDGFLPAE